MKQNLLITLMAAGSIAVLGGCAARDSDMASTQEREMTLGKVQKEIRVGMSQADVAESLGSPNIVTKDGDDNETWVYDKIASEASYSQGHGGMNLLILGFGKSSSRASSSQKTLTVVLKFDKSSKVSKVSYHTSKF